MRRWLAIVAPALLGVVAFVSPRTAPARSEADIAYTREQTFSAALRYLRVDLAYEVTEKDAEAAYLLFSFAAPELEQKSAHGSIEVVQHDRGVRVLVNLPQLPSYHEDVLKRGLLQKLRNEYGEPPAREAKERKDGKKPAPEREGNGGGREPEGAEEEKPESPS